VRGGPLGRAALLLALGPRLITHARLEARWRAMPARPSTAPTPRAHRQASNPPTAVRRKEGRHPPPPGPASSWRPPWAHERQSSGRRGHAIGRRQTRNPAPVRLSDLGGAREGGRPLSACSRMSVSRSRDFQLPAAGACSTFRPQPRLDPDAPAAGPRGRSCWWGVLWAWRRVIEEPLNPSWARADASSGTARKRSQAIQGTGRANHS
jgi:hypothetical protein